MKAGWTKYRAGGRVCGRRWPIATVTAVLPSRSRSPSGASRAGAPLHGDPRLGYRGRRATSPRRRASRGRRRPLPAPVRGGRVPGDRPGTEAAMDHGRSWSTARATPPGRSSTPDELVAELGAAAPTTRTRTSSSAKGGAARWARSRAASLVVTGTMSKAYCMTGWRGSGSRVATAPPCALNSHSIQSTTMSAAKALTGPQDMVRDLAAEYRRRRDAVQPKIDALPGVPLRREALPVPQRQEPSLEGGCRTR